MLSSDMHRLQENNLREHRQGQTRQGEDTQRLEPGGGYEASLGRRLFKCSPSERCASSWTRGEAMLLALRCLDIKLPGRETKMGYCYTVGRRECGDATVSRSGVEDHVISWQRERGSRPLI